ncbi:MAG: stage V sporulation protein AD [Lachnospiraceae bacterium]|nr:stage V sporulation protein AD [Lachnospiraceae bacterium]
MEKKSGQLGVQSVSYAEPVYILGAAAVGGTKEEAGPLGECFDLIAADDKFGAKTWEAAESAFQQNALRIALDKANRKEHEIRYLLSGDLLGQSMASNFGTANFQIPMLGLYGACSTCGEALSIGSMLIAGGHADRVACVTSSHFASAEKEFRYPLDYGTQRPLSASWTVSGSGAFILGKEKEGNVLAGIAGVTPGKVVDYGIKDSMNMGACMAPAAADTIALHLLDFGRKPEDYDRIITGDLGAVGKMALLHLLSKKGFDISKQHMDCGMEIYGENTDAESNSACGQDSHAGGSGCGCAASVLATLILPKLQTKEWKRVLFVPTGALLSKTSFNEGNTVPGVAHGVVIEAV